MPLSKIVARHRDAINSCLANPGVRLLRIVADPEAEVLLTKLLQSLEHQAAPCYVFFGFQHGFTDARTFYASVAEVMGSGSGSDAVPASVPRFALDGDPDETNFASALERWSSALAPYADQVVLVFLPPSEDDGRLLARSFSGLLTRLRTTRVKLILLDIWRRQSLAALCAEWPGTATHLFRLDQNQVEEALNAKLSSPNLPALERSRVLAMLAGIDLAQRRYGAALDKNTEVLEAARKSGNPQEEAAALYNLGNTLFQAGDHSGARQQFERALELAIAHDIHGMAPHALVNVGNTWFMQKRYDQAIEHYEVARRYSKALRNGFGEAHALDNLGLAWQALGEVAAAESAWRETLALYGQVDPAAADMAVYGQVQELERLEALYRSTGRTAEAEQCRAHAGSLRWPGGPLAGAGGTP